MRVELAACLLCMAALAGCQASGGIAGAVTGTTTTALTANPALGAAVGIGTKAITDAASSAVARRWHRTEQDALAETVGRMAVGETRSWRSGRELPFGGTQGEVRVLRVSETPLTVCKEVVFSTAPDEGGDAATEWFLTTACRQPEGWKWAAAEPSTARWASLH